MIKLFLALSLLILTNVSNAGTCTGISRSNYAANSVLTSSQLNLDFNTVYGAYNAIDGGCVTDGTLEFSALSAADFGSITSGVHQGCTLAYSDGNTVSVGKCIATVNGFSIKTAVANTVTWGCSGCSAEVSSTLYYVYIKTGSSGTTLNLLISTTAPGVDGYDASSNKVVGRFYNNPASAIEQYSVESWSVGSYLTSEGKNSTPGATGKVDNFSVSFGTTNATTTCTASPCSYLDQIGTAVTSITRASTGTYTLNTVKTYAKLKCTFAGGAGAPSIAFGALNCSACNALPFVINRPSTETVGDTFGTLICQGIQ